MKEKKLTKETFKVENFEFVDLGLPSKRLWATENAPGHYAHKEAIDAFGKHLPKGAAMVELMEECVVDWNGKKCGITVTGPNGNSIFFPAAGYVDDGELYNNKKEGCYWTSMLRFPNGSHAPLSQTYARFLYFINGDVGPLDRSQRSYGFSVRPLREL